MKNISKFLLVQRDGLENKWWHRLSKVLIFGSTIVVFAISALIIFSDSAWEWKSYTYDAYSFEVNFANTKGEEVKCNFDKTKDTIYSKNPPSISCGDDYIAIREFLPKYNQAIREKFGNKNESCNDKERNESGKLTENALQCFREKNDIVALSPSSFADQFRFALNLKAKRQTHIDYFVLLKKALAVIFITIGWFIFWESIVYRALIYIMLGSKRNL